MKKYQELMESKKQLKSIKPSPNFIIVLMMVSWLILLFVCKLLHHKLVLEIQIVDGVNQNNNVSQLLKVDQVKDILVHLDLTLIAITLYALVIVEDSDSIKDTFIEDTD